MKVSIQLCDSPNLCGDGSPMVFPSIAAALRYARAFLDASTLHAAAEWRGWHGVVDADGAATTYPAFLLRRGARGGLLWEEA